MANKKSYFPHLVVGQANKVSQDYISTNLIQYSGDPSAILNQLITDVENGAALEALKTTAQGDFDAGDIVTSKAELIVLYPDLDQHVEDLTNYDGSDNTFTITVDASVVANLQKFWDSIFVHYILNENAPLQFDLMNAVKIITLSENGLTGTLIQDWWNKCQLVFPNPPFPLPKASVTSDLGSDPGISHDSNDTINTSIIELSGAREMLLCTYDDQIQRERLNKISFNEFSEDLEESTSEDFDRTGRDRDAIDFQALYDEYVAKGNGEELDNESTTAIDEETKKTLITYNLWSDKINVPHTLKRIDKEIGKLVKKYQFNPAQSQLVVLGESILTIDQAVYGQIICEEDTSLSHCTLLHNLSNDIPEREYVQVLGIGNANVIRQEIVRHEADEIAHVENVLQGEHKHKTHRNLKTREEFSFSETERNEETETDTKSTNRFELSKEVNTLVEENQSFEAGVGLSAGYGPVSIQANVGYSTGSSSSESNASSVSLSKELTERALSRIQERSLEIRESRSINEVEVTNEHHINNEGGTDHINGFYYWIDKVYSNQVYNVGKRLMLEFMIPEPAVFHIFSSVLQPKEGVTISKPIHPREYTGDGISTPLRSFNDITRTNYQLWAAKYNAMNITPAPAEIKTIANSYALDYTPGAKTWHDFSFKDLTVPDGYQAEKAIMMIATSHGSNRYIKGQIGNQPFFTNGATPMPLEKTLSQETDIVPLSFRGNYSEYAMNVEVICKLSDHGFDKWRIETYNAILGAYEAQKIEYDSQLAQLEQSVAIQGQNPRLNRETEKTELKKWALELLTLQRFDGFDAMKKASNLAPEMDFEEALVEGQFVKFFEQAIEWHNMTYLFYPYFWAHKQRWTTLKQLGDTDEKFTKFLQAGYARVVVPVHPKFTKSILHYLRSGEIWNGQDLPALNDELYLSIVQEIQEMEDNTEGEEVGDPWETRVPTNLVMITSDIPNDLPGS